MGTINKSIGVLLLSLFITTTAIAQTSSNDNPQNDPRYKDPDTAQIVGILVAGGGHFYAGESGTGALLLGTAVAAPLIGSALSGTTCTSSGYNVSCENNLAPLYLGFAVSFGSWIYSIVDSPKAAIRTNKKNGLLASDTFKISPSLLTTKTNQSGYGIKMRINL